MKKVLLSVLLLLGMSVMFNACETEGAKGKTKNALVGCWLEEQYDYNEVEFYIELTNNGVAKSMVLSGKGYASFKDGVMFTPSSSKWEVGASGKWSEKNGYLLTDFGGTDFNFIDDDTVYMFDTYYYRIKKFRTK